MHQCQALFHPLQPHWFWHVCAPLSPSSYTTGFTQTSPLAAYSFFPNSVVPVTDTACKPGCCFLTANWNTSVQCFLPPTPCLLQIWRGQWVTASCTSLNICALSSVAYLIDLNKSWPRGSHGVSHSSSHSQQSQICQECGLPNWSSSTGLESAGDKSRWREASSIVNASRCVGKLERCRDWNPRGCLLITVQKRRFC